MNGISRYFAAALRYTLLAFGLGLVPGASNGAPTDLNDVPMAVSNQVKANFLVVLDNSQSMDAFMGGALQSGDNPQTRGNLGREVLRGVLDDYRNTFRWGLMSFDAPRPTLRNTHVYYLGNDQGMVFTDDCVNGLSASNGNRRCVANPQSFSGGKYVTYDQSSDDPSILDALYSTSSAEAIWGYSPVGSVNGSTVYDLWFTHVASRGSLWAPAEFADHWGALGFSATDAGYLPSYPTVTRQFYRYRGWGYVASITGAGRLSEAVSADSNEHFGRLIASLGPETNGSTPEIKNGALYTPIAGTLESAKDYFSGLADWRSARDYSSPITAWCQKNFVMLLTDGLPTGNSSGGLYSEKDRTDSCSAWSADQQLCTGTWTYGKAANDSFNAVSALRTVAYSGCTDCTKNFDVQTYVIAMGSNVANAHAVALMNEMAKRGSCTLDEEENRSCVDDGKKAFFADDATKLKQSIADSVSDAIEQSGAAAAVAVANANITESTAAYQSSYESANWTGDLKSYKLNTTTGAPETASALWAAQEPLDRRSASSRKIVSYSGLAGVGQGVQFQPRSAGTATTLSADQEAMLASTQSEAAAIVNYLRGDRSGEQASGSEAQKYRRRIHLLGDIVDAEPVLLGAPNASYNETIDPGYAAFKAANAARPALVFQGANDGLLHAFNAAYDSAAGGGAEEWAYVPSLLFPTLARLSRVSGFSHNYYVDGTPSIGDVDFSRTADSNSTAPNWRSMLVGGLGKGGYGYYALDVSSAIPSDEAAAAAKVLWEFPNAATAGQDVANQGYSFGRPIITKTSDQGWVVLLTSGYNNTRTVEVGGVNYTGDGKGHLFVLNARTGAVLRDIATDAGSTVDPSGLAAFSGYVDNASADNTVTQVYAGDLGGNVWRFDLTGAASTWNVKRLATLVDAAGAAQPVTTAPELASIFEVNATYRFVYVGTGQYLGDSDVTTTATQTMYGLVDDLSATPTITPLRGDTGKLQQQTLSPPQVDAQTGAVTRTATSNAVVLAGGAAKRGWYIDLPLAGERVSTDPQLALGSLVFTSNIPSGVLCVPGGSSYLNILDYRTGGALDTSVLAWSSKYLGDALASRPVLVQLPGGELRALIRLSSDTTIAEGVPAPLASPKVRRVSWRELPDTSK